MRESLYILFNKARKEVRLFTDEWFNIMLTKYRICNLLVGLGKVGNAVVDLIYLQVRVSTTTYRIQTSDSLSSTHQRGIQ